MYRGEGSAADDKPPPSSPLVAELRCSSAAGHASAVASPACAEPAWAAAVVGGDWRKVRAAVHADDNAQVERARRAPKVCSVLEGSDRGGQSRVHATRARTGAGNIDN